MIPPVRVKAVGIGGIGTWFVRALAGVLDAHAPESQLMLIDGDSFEPKNKARQNFSSYGNKADSVARSLRDDFDKIIVSSFPAWVVADGAAPPVNEEDEAGGISRIPVSDLLEEDDIIVLGVDSFAVRKIVFDAAMNIDNIDIYCGGNGDLTGGDALFGSVYHFRRRDGECVTAHPAEYHDEYANPQDRNPGELSCAERAQLDGGEQVVSANMTVAAILLAKFSQTVLSTDPEVIAKSLDNAIVYFDWSAGLASSDKRPPLQSAGAEKVGKQAATAAAL